MNVSRVGLSLFVALLFVVGACENPNRVEESEMRGQIKGTVQSAKGLPVANAKVVTVPASKSVKTDANGKFLIPLVPTGNVVVVATAGGDAKGSVSVKIEANQNTLVDIVMGVNDDGKDDDGKDDDGKDDDGKDDDGKDDDGKDDDGKDDDGKDDDGKDDDGKDDDGKDDDGKDDDGKDDVAPLRKGLIAHIPLDGSAVDLTQNLAAGQISGATPATNRFGARSGAMAFSGRSNITFPPGRINLTGLPTTWSFWMMPMQTAAGNTPPSTVIGAVSQQNGSGLLVIHAQGSVVCRYGSANEQASNNVAAKLPADNQWHHVVIVVSGDALTVFVDGNKAGSSVWRTRPFFDELPKPLQLGYIAGRMGQNLDVPGFSGAIDDVRIYNRALSHDEVRMLTKIN